MVDMCVIASLPICIHGNVKLRKMRHQQLNNFEPAVAGSIIVMQIQSICVLSLALKGYGPMMIASFVGSLP